MNAHVIIGGCTTKDLIIEDFWLQEIESKQEQLLLCVYSVLPAAYNLSQCQHWLLLRKLTGLSDHVDQPEDTIWLPTLLKLSTAIASVTLWQ